MKKGFTLAEVLITLGIIGVVAALTVPTLINNYQTKSWATASQVFEAKFTEALKTMNVQGRLGRYGKYKDTEGFVAELQKHFKITKVCDKDHTMQCFEKTTTVNDKEVDMSAIVDATGFGQNDWGTNVMGIQFANGVTGLIAYNPKCTSDPHNNQINGSDCFALVYDTSGFSDPNEMGKDFNQFGSVKRIGPADCIAELNGVCFTTQAFVPTPVSKAECEANKEAWGLKTCPVDDDYLAGAAKTCGGVKNVATTNDVAAIFSDVTGTEIVGDEEREKGLYHDPEKLAFYGLTANTPTGFISVLGATSDYDNNTIRWYQPDADGSYSDYTYVEYLPRSYGGKAFCVSN